MRRSALLAAVLAVPAVLAATGSDARSLRHADPAETRIIPFSGAFPGCHDPSVLSRIQSRFAHREAGYWNSSLTIVGFDRVRTLAHRPWGPDFVPRGFCSALAHMSDGRVRRVDYAVGEDLGTLGVTWGVTWCVAGLDRNYAFGADCRAARP